MARIEKKALAEDQVIKKRLRGICSCTTFKSPFPSYIKAAKTSDI